MNEWWKHKQVERGRQIRAGKPYLSKSGEFRVKGGLFGKHDALLRVVASDEEIEHYIWPLLILEAMGRKQTKDTM